MIAEGRSSLFSPLDWVVLNRGAGWFAELRCMLAGTSTRTTDRLTLSLIYFCSRGLSTQGEGSYSLVDLLVCLKHNSVLTPLGFTNLISILLFIRKEQTWLGYGYNMHSNMTAFTSGSYYVEARFTLHLNKILSVSCSARTSTFAKIQRQFPSCSYLLLSPIARFSQEIVTQQVSFSHRPASCALLRMS